MKERVSEPGSSWDGIEYEKVSALQRGVGLAFIDALELDALERGGVRRILDVGCGDGYLTEQIARRAHADVVGVDSSPAMIARARKRGSNRLRFAEAEVSTMAFDESFELVVSLNTLHWVLDLPAAFGRLFVAQAAGGRLVCQLVGASEAPSIEDVAVTVTKEDAWRPYFDAHFRPYIHPAEGQLRAIAEGAGYRRVETSTWSARRPSD